MAPFWYFAAMPNAYGYSLALSDYLVEVLKEVVAFKLANSSVNR